jgi:hypothetical protein
VFGMSLGKHAKMRDWSMSKIIRIETGAVGISTNDLTSLLRLYKVKDTQRIKDLVTRGRAGRKPTWYSKYRQILSPVYFQYIEYETAASIIRSYEEILVPGLMQTEEYATSITRQYRQDFTVKTVKTLVEVRMRRQELLLDRSNPPLLFFIIDEAVISRLLGEDRLRKAQLDKLISMADRPQITIEIVPFAAGLHRGMSDTFSILEFPGPAGDVIYFEGVRDSIFTRDATEEIAAYRELFEDLRKISLGPKGTLDYLVKVADGIRLTLISGNLTVAFIWWGVELKDLTWRVSSWSAGGNCVEVAGSKTTVFVRDSKNRNQGILPFPATAWEEFIKAVRTNSSFK